VNGQQVTFRWVNLWEATEAELAQIDRIVQQHGWVKLNPDTTRILLAEERGRICGFSVVQMMPYVGPLYVNKFHRGTGVAEKLADQTMAFLKEVEARGWLVIADSEHTERICRERAMQEIQSPVYVFNAEQEVQ
jgi:hypothetical protein